MELLIKILIGVIAFFHLYFLYFEMFAWTTKGRKIFRKYPAEFFEKTKALAANQGLYNGFLAAGLIFGLISGTKSFILFFLCCIIIAGVYGAYSTKKIRLFYVQSVPAIISILVVLLT